MGRVDEVAVVAERGRRVENKVGGLLRYLTAFGEVWALALAGEFDSAEIRSADLVRISSAGQYLAWGMANVLSGTIELARGSFLDTVPRMEQTVAALTSESAASWSFPARLLLIRGATQVPWPLTVLLVLVMLSWLPQSLRLAQTLGRPNARLAAGVVIVLLLNLALGLYPNLVLNLLGVR